MRKKRLLASLGITAALAAGGLGAVWLGAPGISGAQTSDTTAPPTTVAPGTAPAPNPSGHNCPNMGGSGSQGSAPSGASATVYRAGARFR